MKDEIDKALESVVPGFSREKKFSVLLKESRLKRELTQSEAAFQFGWSATYYRRYEKDDGGLFPSSKTNYDKFSRFLDISPEELKEIIYKEIGKKQEDF
jgi:transcriptional regulator with XRE-family HTH domain